MSWGSGDEEAKELNILKRIARYAKGNVCIEAGPRHSEVIISELGLVWQWGSRAPGAKGESGKAVKGKGDGAEKDAADDSDMEFEYVDALKAKKFRALAARLNHVVSKRPDLQYSVKECVRHLARPQVGSWQLLKKIGRYLRYRQCLLLEYTFLIQPQCISVYSDSDWAGCARTRRSTSGGSFTGWPSD